MNIIEFKFKPSCELDKPVFRVLADKPLIDDKLHPDDVIILNKIANALSTNEKQVTWIWYRWSR